MTGLRAEARLAAPLGLVAAGGGLPEGAAAAAERLIASGATALLSFGLCGGLDPALPAGALVVPRAVGRHDADPALSEALGGANCAVLHPGEHVVAGAEAKARLFAATGAAAVDLESGAVAAAAARHGVPFAVLRAVCDPAGFDLPPAALAALDQAGAIGLWRVASSVLAGPGQIPALLAIARHAAAARGALVRRVAEILDRNRRGMAA